MTRHRLRFSLRSLTAGQASRLVSLAVATLFVVAAAPPAGAAVEGAAAIGFLNQQRAANGIPRVSRVDQAMVAWCPNEDAPWTDGSTARDWSSRTGWSASQSPWDAAPLHQFSLYDPNYTAAGASSDASGACLGLGGGYPEYGIGRGVHGPTFFAWYADTGAAAVATREVVTGEGPFAPQEKLGIPQGVATGPQLMLYALGLRTPVRAVRFGLSAAAGGVVRGVGLVDNQLAGPGSLFFVDGGVLITPVLAAGTSYAGWVLWQGADGQEATQHVAFTTAATPVPAPGRPRTPSTPPLRLVAARGRLTVIATPRCLRRAAGRCASRSLVRRVVLAVSVRLVRGGVGVGRVTITLRRIDIHGRAVAVATLRSAATGAASGRVVLIPGRVGSAAALLARAARLARAVRFVVAAQPTSVAVTVAVTAG
jgi:hypothetical protein